MRDLVGWNLPLGRWFGIHVRLHVFFVLLVVVALSMSIDKDPQKELLVDVAITLTILFLSVLAHEVGHCIAARQMDGRVDQIVLWPLGGLAPINLSHQPQEEMVTAAAGPLVNMSIAVVAVIPLLFMHQDLRAVLNPLRSPQPPEHVTWVYCLQLVVWVNWLLTMVNVLPAYPLDGGRVLRSLIWQRKGYRTAVTMVAMVAKLTALAICVTAGVMMYQQVYPEAVLPLTLLGVLFYFSAKQESERLHDRETDDGLLGYDFSQGYTSLEKNFDAIPRRSPGLMRQWLDNRREARRLRQKQIEEQDDQRVDDVLARLHDLGRDALSDEDRALLDRVSARYRNRQQG
ncbi:MAG TPA: M50 family metallopeptidase [Pirellulales bacterium]|jgi:Zn-dependent protease